MRYKYTKELLEPIVAKSFSWAEVCRKLGIKAATGSQSHLTKRAKTMGLDYSHFTGSLWSKGKTLPPRRPIEEYLVEIPIHYTGSDKLKRRLIKEGLKEAKCEKCGLINWLGKKIAFHLDHINRNHFDNRLLNLQILCPNCHAQKTTQDRQGGLVKW